jgi:hypothetical protein
LPGDDRDLVQIDHNSILVLHLRLPTASVAIFLVGICIERFQLLKYKYRRAVTMVKHVLLGNSSTLPKWQILAVHS